jgi:hypothetical protein
LWPDGLFDGITDAHQQLPDCASKRGGPVNDGSIESKFTDEQTALFGAPLRYQLRDRP